MKQESFVENASGRHADDFYRTPAPVTMALCDEFKRRGIEPKTILDVGCGDGAIGSALRAAWPASKIYGIEADNQRSKNAYFQIPGRYDGVYFDSWGNDFRSFCKHEFDLIVSNPPFRHALAFMRLALDRVRSGGYVAFLLISQWDQETVHDDERGKFLDSLRGSDGSEGYGQLRWKGRIDFRGDGCTDRVSHSWYIIGPGFEGVNVRIPRSPVGGPEQLTLGGIV